MKVFVDTTKTLQFYGRKQSGM